MKASVALGASAVCAGLAVALVGVDLAFNLDYHLDTRRANGEWADWASSTARDSPTPARPYGACAGRDLRLSVHNGELWPVDVPVSVDYYGGDGGYTQPVRGTWHLERGESRELNFTIPVAAFHINGGAATEPKPVAPNVYVTVLVGKAGYLSTCVAQEAPA